MKVLYYHQYFSTPAGAAGTRSYALARCLVEAGHQVRMVCLRDARTHTGLTGPFTFGKRSGLVDGIEVIEFDLPYSNHAGFWERASVLLATAGTACSWRFVRSGSGVCHHHASYAGIPAIVACWLLGSPFVFEVRDLWPELLEPWV